jgi:hypothetical protein
LSDQQAVHFITESTDLTKIQDAFVDEPSKENGFPTLPLHSTSSPNHLEKRGLGLMALLSPVIEGLLILAIMHSCANVPLEVME